jgi:hypothetical protein
MDSLITAAGRPLSAGDPLGSLKRVALRDDAPALCASRHRDGAARLAPTTEPRILISLQDDASLRCKRSKRPAQLSGFRLFMPRSTTPSTPGAISHLVKHFASSEARHSAPGEWRRRHGRELSPQVLCDSTKLPVTKPLLARCDNAVAASQVVHKPPVPLEDFSLSVIVVDRQGTHRCGC